MMPFAQHIADGLSTWLCPAHTSPIETPAREVWNGLLPDMRCAVSDDHRFVFNRVAQGLGVDPSLPHSNPSRRREQRDYRGYYNEKLARMVGERYREDCELFGYSF